MSEPGMRSLQGKNAALQRWHPDDPNLPRARHEYVAGRFRERIEELVKNAPPLTQSQRDAIAAVLQPVLQGEQREAG